MNKFYTTSNFVQRVNDLAGLNSEQLSNDSLSQLMVSMLICNTNQLSNIISIDKNSVAESIFPLETQIFNFAAQSGFMLKKD